MEILSDGRDKRRYPRFYIDLPLEYWEVNDFRGSGGIVVNASEEGFLIESVKKIPVGAKLDIAVLFPKGFELADFKVAAEIVWEEPYWKEDWEGYQYGLRVSQILKEDHEKLKLLLNGRFDLEKIDTFTEVKREYRMPKGDTEKIRRYNVLVVDDDEGVRKLLVTLLPKEGIIVYKQ